MINADKVGIRSKVRVLKRIFKNITFNIKKAINYLTKQLILSYMFLNIKKYYKLVCS